jgi:DNA modification methylase
MTIVRRISLSELVIPVERQRKEFTPEAIIELGDSIDTYSLLHPLIIRKDDKEQTILVAGWRRLNAIKYLWGTGRQVKCGTEYFPEDQLPCNYLGEIDPIEAFAIELEENIKREDLSWQDRALAMKKLQEVRAGQAERRGELPPSIKKLSVEVHGASAGSQDLTRKEIIVSRNLHIPEVAAAKNINEAFKVLKRKEEAQKNAELATRLGPTFTSACHTLLQGDCIEIMRTLCEQGKQFDVIITDPPYGIDAQDFSDSGGKTPGGHFYDDSYESWVALMKDFSCLTERITKPSAHLYCFCDIDHFHELKLLIEIQGWRVFRTPLIWINPSGMRAPWPEHGPQRKWQAILFAVKGDRKVTRLYSDVLVYPSEENLGHHAQKPVGLYRDLLLRSISPGDTALDPFCGSGPIFPAAHELKVLATGIEKDASAAGIAGKRLESLK